MFSSGHKLLPLGDFRPLCQNLKQCVFLSTKVKVEKTSENAFDLQTLINEIFRYFIEMDFFSLIFFKNLLLQIIISGCSDDCNYY